jgi:hypothetical protein
MLRKFCGKIERKVSKKIDISTIFKNKVSRKEGARDFYDMRLYDDMNDRKYFIR